MLESAGELAHNVPAAKIIYAKRFSWFLCAVLRGVMRGYAWLCVVMRGYA